MVETPILLTFQENEIFNSIFWKQKANQQIYNNFIFDNKLGSHLERPAASIAISGIP